MRQLQRTILRLGSAVALRRQGRRRSLKTDRRGDGGGRGLAQRSPVRKTYNERRDNVLDLHPFAEIRIDVPRQDRRHVPCHAKQSARKP
jgi:hypothetical protein